MAATTKTWVNNNLPQCEDDDLNGFKNENNNLIEGSGQTLSTADQQQTHKAVVQYSTDGDFYSDSGVADAYVLSALSSKASPHSLTDGMRVRFIPANANTGASTINVAGLGSKNIKLPDGSNPAAGDISSRVTLVFDSANDWFELQIATEGQRGIVELSDSSQALAGTDTLTAMTPARVYEAFNKYGLGESNTISGDINSAFSERGLAQWLATTATGTTDLPAGVASGFVIQMGSATAGFKSFISTSYGSADQDIYYRRRPTDPWVKLAHNGNTSSGTTENDTATRVDGFIQKWGRVSIPGTGDTSGAVVFPVAFPSDCLNVQLTLVDSSGIEQAAIYIDPADLPDATGFGWQADNIRAGSEFYYLAIGY